MYKTINRISHGYGSSWKELDLQMTGDVGVQNWGRNHFQALHGFGMVSLLTEGLHLLFTIQVLAQGRLSFGIETDWTSLGLKHLNALFQFHHRWYRQCTNCYQRKINSLYFWHHSLLNECMLFWLKKVRNGALAIVSLYTLIFNLVSDIIFDNLCH